MFKGGFTVLILGAFYTVLKQYIMQSGNPIRAYLRDNLFEMDNVEDIMIAQTENFFDPIDGIPDSVPEVDWQDLTKKKFYKHYLSKSKPVLVKGMAQQWPAYTKW